MAAIQFGTFDRNEALELPPAFLAILHARDYEAQWTLDNVMSSSSLSIHNERQAALAAHKARHAAEEELARVHAEWVNAENHNRALESRLCEERRVLAVSHVSNKKVADTSSVKALAREARDEKELASALKVKVDGLKAEQLAVLAASKAVVKQLEEAKASNVVLSKYLTEMYRMPPAMDAMQKWIEYRMNALHSTASKPEAFNLAAREMLYAWTSGEMERLIKMKVEQFAGDLVHGR